MSLFDYNLKKVSSLATVFALNVCDNEEEEDNISSQHSHGDEDSYELQEEQYSIYIR